MDKKLLEYHYMTLNESIEKMALTLKSKECIIYNFLKEYNLINIKKMFNKAVTEKKCKMCPFEYPAEKFPILRIYKGVVYRRSVCRVCYNKLNRDKRKSKE